MGKENLLKFKSTKVLHPNETETRTKHDKGWSNSYSCLQTTVGLRDSRLPSGAIQ